MESKLTESAIQYLAIAKVDDPQTYEKRRLDFEAALAAYLRATKNSKNILLRVTRDGKTFHLPLQVIDTGRLSDENASGDRMATGGEFIGQVLKGEILDLLLCPKSKEMPQQIIALFSDSLLGLAWPDISRAKPAVYRFHRDSLRNASSMFASGVLRTVNAEPPSSPYLVTLTSNLKSAVVLKQTTGGFTPVEVPASSFDMTMPTMLRSVDAQECFRHVLADLPPFRSLRSLPDSGLFVMLDEKGFLNLYSELHGPPLWRSDRAWGNRLFVLQPDRVAVCNCQEKSFVAFQRQGQRLRIFGQSPAFEGRVSAILPVSFKERNGLLSSIVFTGAGEEPLSRLYFLPRETIAWNPEANLPQPQFPDYDAQVTFLQSAARLPLQQDWHLPYPVMIWCNVFENLFAKDGDGHLLEVLARHAQPDSTWRVWRISLRQGVRFSDGSPLTAEAVRTGWEATWRLCKAQHCAAQWLWECILGAKAFAEGNADHMAGLQMIDDYTLQVILDEPRPNFTEHLAQACFSIIRWDREKNLPLGTGRFRPVAGKSVNGGSMFFERNAFHHRGQPLLKGLQLDYYRSEVVEVLTNHPAPIATITQKSDIEYIKQIETIQLQRLATETIYFLAINPNPKPLSEIDYRRCVAAALDREVLAGIIENAECTAKSSFFSNADSITPAAPACSAVRRGRPLGIFYQDGDKVARTIAERLTARLTQLGIPRRPPKGVAGRLFEELRRTGDYDILVDSYAPLFDSPRYDLAQMISRGCAVDSTVAPAIAAMLASSSSEPVVALENNLIQDATLFPVVGAKNYLIMPAALIGQQSSAAQSLDLSKAWLPR